jgi:DNA-binding IclR family transcriptional regulator
MRAVRRILGIFESFTEARTSLTLQEIADHIELPKSTTFRIVRSLEQEGYLLRLDDQQYCLSFRFTRLAGLVRSTLGIREIARHVMTALADATKETVSIHTISGRNRVCIDAVATVSLPLRSVSQPGEHIALGAGSSSKTLSAYLPKKALIQTAAQIARATGHTQAEVLAGLETIRTREYAVSHGERVLGVSSVSAPIKGPDEQVLYCLSVAGPSVRVRSHETEFVKLVVRAARDILRRYGGRLDGDLMRVSGDKPWGPWRAAGHSPSLTTPRSFFHLATSFSTK